jgi:putative sigma-54 modulation protein
MQTSLTFKNIEPSDTLNTYVSSKLNRFDKYLDNPAEASVVLAVEKHRHIAEINITGDRMVINGKEETTDMYSAIDMVLDKLETQIKKTKAKKRKRRGGNKPFDAAADMAPRGLEEEMTAGAPRVHVQHIEYKPMDVDEAVLQMDLVEDAFMVFNNARTNSVNVLYRRKDGDYGLIQPNL